MQQQDLNNTMGNLEAKEERAISFVNKDGLTQIHLKLSHFSCIGFILAYLIILFSMMIVVSSATYYIMMKGYNSSGQSLPS
jgi:hypothetical protein